MPDSRAKGLSGEREVRELYERYGFTVRGLEGEGDHLVLGLPVRKCSNPACSLCRPSFTIHSEVKRRERINVCEHWRQAEQEAPAGTIPVLAHRQNRQPWLVTLRMEDFLGMVTR